MEDEAEDSEIAIELGDLQISKIEKLSVSENDILLARIPSNCFIPRHILNKTFKDLKEVIKNKTGMDITICLIPTEADITVISMEDMKKAGWEKEDIK